MRKSNRFVSVISMPVLAVVAVWAAPAISLGQIADGYLFTTLPEVPGGFSPSPQGISGNTIVGYYRDATSALHGFLFDGENFTPLDDPSAKTGNSERGTSALGISGTTIVGGYTDNNNELHGFVFNGSSFENLDGPLGPLHNSVVTGISDNNTVGGYSDINGNRQSYFFDGTTFSTISVPSSTLTIANAVSGNTVAGTFTDQLGMHGFAFDGDAYATLNDPLAQVYDFKGGLIGVTTQVTGISGDLIVGNYGSGSAGNQPINHGFIFDGSTYLSINDPLGVNTTITGIDGTTIVGTYVDSSGRHGFVATAVPEPASIFVLATLSMLLLLRRRPRNFAAPI